MPSKGSSSSMRPRIRHGSDTVGQVASCQTGSCLTVLQRWEVLERTNLKQRNCSCGDILNFRAESSMALHTLLDVTSGFADSSYAWHYHRHLLNEDRKGFG